MKTMIPGGGDRRVVIRCPQTGELIPTGVQMDAKAFATVTLRDYITICPKCGATHKWSKSDAVPET